MSDQACLIRIDDVQFLILHEPLRILHVVLQVADALVYFSLGLSNWFAHFLGHQSGILVFVFREDLLKIAKFLKAALDARMTLCIFVSEALVGSID